MQLNLRPVQESQTQNPICRLALMFSFDFQRQTNKKIKDARLPQNTAKWDLTGQRTARNMRQSEAILV